MKLVRKNILQYPTLFFPNGDGGYDVSFPQFPGCVTFGRTFEEAQTKAAEVLELWIEELSEHDVAIPNPEHLPILARVATSVPTRIPMTRSYATPVGTTR